MHQAPYLIHVLPRGILSAPDLNLLVALDVLLVEGNVARAARRLGLSASAMSRTLARLRETTGDPLLVRAGRGLVPTPRAMELRDRVGPLVNDAHAILRPGEESDVGRLVRTFTLRTSEGFVENFGPALIARVSRKAPGVRLRFLSKADKDGAPLRDGRVDLETGVVEATMSPELRTQGLFRDRIVGVVGKKHPLSRGRVTRARYAAGRHVLVSRLRTDGDEIDNALASLGLTRQIVAIVGGFNAALALARASDLIASVPEKHTGNLRTGMFTFALPVTLPDITVSLLWHPRLDADAAHRWLRTCVRAVCAGSSRLA